MQQREKIIAHTIHIHVLDWEAFVEFPYDDIPCTGTLFNNLEGVHYKLITNNLKNNMLLMLLKYLAAILEIFRFHFKCIATVNTFNNRTLYSYISINKMFMFLIKADKNKHTEHR